MVKRTDLFASERQPLQPIFPLRRFRRQPDEQEFLDRCPDIEALRNQKYAAADPARISERAEVPRHGANIMGDEQTLFRRRNRQDLNVLQPSQPGAQSRLEIDGGLAAQNPSYDGLIEIRVRQETDFHDDGAVCSSARARRSLSRRFAGNGSAARFPSAHFSPWRIRWASTAAWLAR